MSYDNEKSGALFRNAKKEEGSQQPDYRGEIVLDGKKWEVAGWKKQSKNGNPYLSLKLQEPREPKQEAKPQRTRDTAFDDMDSTIPF
jgi:uncharacterized protein (DUF736 family)